MTPVASRDRRAALATFGDGSYRYELSIEQDQQPDPFYREKFWRFHIRLLQDGRVLDALSPFSPACSDAEPSDVAEAYGADPEALAWRTTQGDHCDVYLAARIVRLAPCVSGLLVTQRTGQESIYQLHWLFSRDNGRLNTAWDSPTGPGHASRVRILPAGSNQEDDVAFIDAASPSDGEPNTLEAARLHFDGAKGVVTTRLPDARSALFLATLGDFPTLDAALQDWIRYRPCSFQFRIFRAEEFPGASAKGFLLATVLARQEDAQGERAKLAQCAGTPNLAVVEYHAAK